MDLLTRTETHSHCPFKGDASYWSARLDDGTVRDVAWSYETPLPERVDIAGRICFYHERVDEMTVDGLAVTPSPP
jgi:uncharacterized protein (DUF427 family)